MISDITSVLSLLNDLLTRKSEINREYFENFIEPIWSIFTQIHEDYKESLHRYRNLLLRGENPVDVLHQINFDSCLAEDLRVRLAESMSSISSQKSTIKEAVIYDFASYILDYFDSTKQLNLANCEGIEKVSQIQSNQLSRGIRKMTKQQSFLQRFKDKLSIEIESIRLDLSDRLRENLQNLHREKVFNSIASQLQNSKAVSTQKVYRETILVIQDTLMQIQNCYRRAAKGYFLVRQELLK